jgi:hypothetical protein
MLVTHTVRRHAGSPHNTIIPHTAHLCLAHPFLGCDGTSAVTCLFGRRYDIHTHTHTAHHHHHHHLVLKYRILPPSLLPSEEANDRVHLDCYRTNVMSSTCREMKHCVAVTL